MRKNTACMKGMVVLTVKPSVIHIIYEVTDRILFRYQNHRNNVNVYLRLYIETQHTCKIQINRDQLAQCYQDHFQVPLITSFLYVHTCVSSSSSIFVMKYKGFSFMTAESCPTVQSRYGSSAILDFLLWRPFLFL